MSGLVLLSEPEHWPEVVRQAPRLVMAYSGGRDSTALLHALSQALPPERLLAVHVDHGLQAQSAAWAQQCRQQASHWGVMVAVASVQIDPADPAGLEAAARAARYRALLQHCGPDDVLVTAHHRRDQAETLLLQALRGGALQSLAGLRALRRLRGRWLWRPLLDGDRAAIDDYLQQSGLHWIDDPHNAQSQFQRSWLRHEILPALRARDAAAEQRLAATARRLQDDADLLGAYLEADLATAVLADVSMLSIPVLADWSPSRRLAVLRHWLVTHCATSSPPERMLARIDEELIAAREDAQPQLHWPGGELRRYRQTLHFLRTAPPAPEPWHVRWRGAGGLELPQGQGRLVCAHILPDAEFGWLSGTAESVRLQGCRHHKSLKQWFQERAVPPWRRGLTPVARINGVPQWIGGLGAMQDADPAWGMLHWVQIIAERDAPHDKMAP